MFKKNKRSSQRITFKYHIDETNMLLILDIRGHTDAIQCAVISFVISFLNYYVNTSDSVTINRISISPGDASFNVCFNCSKQMNFIANLLYYLIKNKNQLKNVVFIEKTDCDEKNKVTKDE